MNVLARTMAMRAASQISNKVALFKPTSAFQSFRGTLHSPYSGFRGRRFLGAFAISLPVKREAVRRYAAIPTTDEPYRSKRPSKDTILLDGCDYEHWLIVMEAPQGNPTRDEIIDSYIKTLAQVVGSEQEARMKIYSVSTKHYFSFGCLVSEELSKKIKPLPGVRWVLLDSYADPATKSYGWEPFINGQAVPYDPKYHEEWLRTNARCNQRRANTKPKNFDRARNFERQREMRNAEYQRQMSPSEPSSSNMEDTVQNNVPSRSNNEGY